MITESENLIVDRVIADLGKDLRIALPLGIGKATHIINAFFLRAKEDPEIQLKIYTALSLSKPQGRSLLETRFLEPLNERIFAQTLDPLYELYELNGSLPKNIEVYEFYFQAGKKLDIEASQQNYISSNYTHVARDLVDRGVNVIAQIVAPSNDGETFSLSCNPDVTLDLVQILNETKPYPFTSIAQVNTQLPFMYGDAIVNKNFFHHLLKNDSYNFKIFAPPKRSVPLKDYFIGLYASTLIKDGGEIQVGIGSLGDALVHFLLLREQKNKQYQEIISELQVLKNNENFFKKKGGVTPFKKGLFAASEMLVDGFMHLFEAGILKKKVYDHVTLQRLLNENLITEVVSPEMLSLLLERGAIHRKLTKEDFEFLQYFGVFKDELVFYDEEIEISNGHRISSQIDTPENLKKICENCLGQKLKKGAVIHGGFFIGPQAFYQWLNDLPDEKRKLIHMKSVTKINQLYGHEELDRLHRKDARFVNTCLIMTLSGAAVSDGLEDGRVVSGVGGQYNFVSMAHALPDGHSILQLRSTRGEGEGLRSSIVFNYGHITIPRHLRDIVITEYGIANLRGKTDSEIASALIEIADSRFQGELIEKAKAAGKLKKSYILPESCRQNTPDKLQEKIKKFDREEIFPPFPFGTDFTPLEIELGTALKKLKKKSRDPKAILRLFLKSFFIDSTTEKTQLLLKRMSLNEASSFKEKFYRRLLISVIDSPRRAK